MMLFATSLLFAMATTTAAVRIWSTADKIRRSLFLQQGNFSTLAGQVDTTTSNPGVFFAINRIFMFEVGLSPLRWLNLTIIYNDSFSSETPS
jgi:hypothetical protein